MIETKIIQQQQQRQQQQQQQQQKNNKNNENHNDNNNKIVDSCKIKSEPWKRREMPKELVSFSSPKSLTMMMERRDT